MTTVAISNLPEATIINPTDIIAIVQPGPPAAGTTKRLTKTLLFTSPTMVTPVLGAATATSLAVSTTFGVTGVSTLTAGAVIQGMTVGRGLAAIASNTAAGVSALSGITTGSQNTAVGNNAARLIQAADNCVAVGNSALINATAGTGNTAIGSLTLANANPGGSNTAVGNSALFNATGGSNTAIGDQALLSAAGGCVAIGKFAGTYEINANAFYVNNQDRTNTAGDKASSLMYGTFNATASSQTLVVNAGSSTFTGAVVVGAPAEASISAVATLTNANLQAQLINTTGTSYTLTMPLGSTLETLITWAAVDIGFNFSVINTASGTITMAANTGVTTLGGLTIATGVSAQFRIRRTAASTFVMYRIA